MGLLVFLVVSTLVVSGLCSLMEATLYSARAVTIEAESDADDKAARTFLGLKKNVSASTSAILILNTIANTAGATYAGTVAGQVFDPSTAYIVLPIFSAGLTLGILFLSEIIPKTIGATRWRRTWRFVARPLAFIVWMLGPLVRFTEWVTRSMTGSAPQAVTTEAEILAMVRLGEQSGQVSAAEMQMVANVLRFDNVRCRQIMVPRRDVVMVQIDATIEDTLAKAAAQGHTRYPLVTGSLDQTVGVLHVKDLLRNPESLESIKRPMLRAPDSLLLPDLLAEMRRSRSHMALVVDEFGTAVGVVTLENVLEQIVGTVQDEFDAEEPDIVKDGDDAIVRGLVPLAVLRDRLGARLETGPDVDTLSGLVVSELGRLPKVGDAVELPDEGMRLEVLEVTAHRADQVRVSPLESPGDDIAPDV